MTPEVVCTVVLLVVFVAAVDMSALVVLVPTANIGQCSVQASRCLCLFVGNSKSGRSIWTRFSGR